MNQILFSMLERLKRLKAMLKDACTPAVHNSKTEPSALAELCTRLDGSLAKVKDYDRRLKQTTASPQKKTQPKKSRAIAV